MAKIAVDCDGVLANFIKAFVEEANHIWPGRFPKPLEYSLRDHKWWNFPPEILSKAETKQVWARVNGTPNWWLKLDAFSENMAALQVFLYTQHGHDVYIVTSRAKTVGMTVAKQTQIWIDACGVQPLQNYLAVLASPDAVDKSNIYLYGGFDYSVDDKGDTVLACDRLSDHKAFLLDRPWNQDFDVKHRVKNLDEFFKVVQNEAVNVK